MTPEAVRALAQQDPTKNLTARWGDLTIQARARAAALEDSLRDLELVTGQLGERGLVVATDLGPTGNSARSSFQAASADKTQAFQLPREAA